ncbi:ORF285 [White spot syndrome virus]|uniref:ORF285 n=1 Tax=White spot syndrome virus TaxID=342409 RepID=A0A2D3I6G7_9VIRU|nr:ORF285 [White spot syndrome virus]
MPVLLLQQNWIMSITGSHAHAPRGGGWLCPCIKSEVGTDYQTFSRKPWRKKVNEYRGGSESSQKRLPPRS